jgi:hypothetical protein
MTSQVYQAAAWLHSQKSLAHSLKTLCSDTPNLQKVDGQSQMWSGFSQVPLPQCAELGTSVLVSGQKSWRFQVIYW